MKVKMWKSGIERPACENGENEDSGVWQESRPAENHMNFLGEKKQ